MKTFDLNYIKNHWFYKSELLNFDKMTKASILIPICKIKNEFYIIFEKRAKNITQGDEICFPGGKYEKSDKNFQFTSIRETSEELGISKENIEILKELDIFVTPFNSVIYSFLGYINIDDFNNFNFDKKEVQKLLFVPISWFLENEPETYKIQVESSPYFFDENQTKFYTFPAKKLGLPDKYHTSWSNGNREIFLYDYHGEKIWGFTASILKNFIDKYKIL